MKFSKLLRRTLAVVLAFSVILSLGAGAFAAEATPAAETTVQTKSATRELVNGTDYLLLDFCAGTAERDYGWKAKTATGNVDVTWEADSMGVMSFTVSGTDPYVAMPSDGTNRLNYMIKTGDVIVARVRLDEAVGTGTTTSTIYYIPGDETGYSSTYTVGASTKLDMGSAQWQNVIFTGIDACVGQTLKNIRIDLFNGSDKPTVEARIDSIYVGPADTVPFVYGGTKTLSTYNNTTGVDDYTITLEAFSTGAATDASYASPIDIAIVFDRSGSMSQQASSDDLWTVDSAASSPKTVLNNILNTLDKTKYEGYYRALSWFYGYSNANSYTHGGQACWMPMRYNETTQEWEMAVIQCYELKGEYDRPFGVMSFYNSLASQYITWMGMEEAYDAYEARRTADSGNADSYDFQICIPRITRAVEAMESFVTALNATAANLPEGECHTVSVLSYGGTVFEEGYPFYNDVDSYITNTDDLGVSCTSVKLTGGSVDTLLQTLRGTYVYGATRTDCAMEVLAGTTGAIEESAGYTSPTLTATDYLPAATEGRERAVILLTDGCPTNNTEYRHDFSMNAINAAYTLKQEGCKVFAIGCMPYLDESAGYDSTKWNYNAGTLSDTDQAKVAKNSDNFLQLLSSNYPSATASQSTSSTGATITWAHYLSSIAYYYTYTPGEKNDDGINYYMTDDGSGTALLQCFEDVLKSISSNLHPASTGSIFLYDEITREFMVDSDRNVNIYAVKYLGGGVSDNANYDYTNKTLLGSHWFSPNGGDKSGVKPAYTIKFDASVNDGESSAFTIEWTDAPQAALRETEYTTSSVVSGYAEGYGYKLLVEIPIEVKRVNTIGGNNIQTNVNTSGVYSSDPSVLDTSTGRPANESTNKPITYSVPNANIQPNYDFTIHDYFMDLETASGKNGLIDVLKNGGLACDKDVEYVFSRVFTPSTSSASLLNSSGNNRNDYVSISISVLTNDKTRQLYSVKADAGADAFSAQKHSGGYYANQSADFDFTTDAALKVRIYIYPTTYEVDSTGTAPYALRGQDASGATVNGSTRYETKTKYPNYYAPKLAVVDFDGEVAVPMQNEKALSLTLSSANGSYDSTNGTVNFDFRSTYGTGSQLFINKSYKVLSYSVTAVNTPKDASGNAVTRKLHIIPANVMSYDDTMGHFNYTNAGTAVWETVGTYSEIDQVYDNTAAHGYDESFIATGTEDYHASSHAVTVSDYSVQPTATFSFWGTGFDIISRTSPDSGVMLVEVCTDGAYENDVKYYVVDNYLAGDTLYQIPVVHCTDLDYKAYYVRVTAYYHAIFDHNLSKKSLVTEEKVRELLDIPEDVEITFISADSSASSTRAITTTPTKGQYNVYIDGVRIYNTLGNTLGDAATVANNEVVTYAYGLANEGYASIYNIKDLLIDSDDWSTTNEDGESATGVAYIAADSSTTEADGVYVGRYLGMGGRMCYVEVDGVKYLVKGDTDNDVLYDDDGNPVWYYLPESLSYKLKVTVSGDSYTCATEGLGTCFNEKTGTLKELAAALNTEINARTEYSLSVTQNDVYSAVKMTLNANGTVTYTATTVDKKDETVTYSEISSYVTINSFYLRSGSGSTEFTVNVGKNIKIYYTERDTGWVDYFAVGTNIGDLQFSHRELCEILDREIYYYSDRYDAIGPENEVYLNGYNGVAFQVKDAARVLVSAKSVNGTKLYLQVFDADKTNTDGTKTGLFVTLSNPTYVSATEMYYDVTDYVTDGMVIIRNANPNSLGTCLSACNIKLIGEKASISINSATIAAGIAAIRSAAETPLDDAVTIKHSLNLASDISVNFVVEQELLESYDSFYLEACVNGESSVIEATTVGSYYYFTLDAMTAVEMNDEINATLHMFKDGVEYVSETDVYSIATYAYSQLSKDSASDELKSICANLLRYGAAAQSFKGYNTENLADSAMTDEHKAYLTDLEAVSVESKAEALGDVVNGIAWAGKVLVLDTKVTVKAVFDLSGYTGDVSALNLRVSYTDCDGAEHSLVISEAEVYNADKGYYSFSIDTLLAADMRSVLTIALYEGDVQASETQLYSVESYACGKSGDLLTVCKALLAYSDAAKAYFTK